MKHTFPNKFNYILVTIFSLYFSGISAQVNLFQNTENDEDWNNAANWSLNIVPTALHDVTIVSGEQLKIKTGESGIAKTITITTTDTFIVQEMANLTIADQIIISNTGFFSNRGKTTFNANSNGFYITVGGSFTNQDTVIMNSPMQGFDFRGGTVKNNGYINIINPLKEGILMYQASVFPNQRHFYNNANGHISISAANGYGIYVADTLTNAGVIEISNTFRYIPSAECFSMYVQVFGKVYNHGSISLSGSDDNSLINHGNYINYDDSFLEVLGFENDGIINHGNFQCYGELDIFGYINYPNNAGIKSYNVFNFNEGSHTEINGSYDLNFGIYSEYPMVVDTNAYLSLKRIVMDGIYNAGGFTNHGTIEATDMTDTLTYGIHSLSIFDNYGTINMYEMGSGITSQLSTFNNYGDLTFHNLISKAIFARSTFNNYAGGNITVTNDDGNRIAWGIIFVDITVFNLNFSNYGSISIDSSHVGLHIRQGNFFNDGDILINHFRQAINMGDFSEIPYLYNAGNLILRNQEEPLIACIDLEQGSSGFPNLINYSDGIIDIKDAFRGFDVKSGLLNQGLVKMGNIEQYCFRLENYTDYNDVRNDYSGTMDIINTGNVIRFGYSESMTNQIFFINYGLFKFKLLTDTFAESVNSIGVFENYGTMMGDGIINCDNAIVNAHYRPGQNIGLMTFLNYQSSLNPTFFIQLRGNDGIGNANGNDGIIVEGQMILSGTLDVGALPGFTTAEDSIYTILKADTIVGNFSSEQLPFIDFNYYFDVLYTDTTVVLKVVKNPKNWSGNCDSIWTNPCNWFGGIVPDSTDTAIITGDAQFFPKLTTGSFSVGNGSGNQQCRRLLIFFGGSLETNDIPVNISNFIQNHGLLRFRGNQAVICEEEAEIIIEEGGEMKVGNP